MTARLIVRAVCAASLAGLALLAPGSAAAAPEAAPHLEASMQCERAIEPGRVRCSLEAHAGEGTIRWADMVIVSLPDFASALKGRVAPTDATARDPSRYTWAFGLVARHAGKGEARARVRAVVCTPGPSGKSCVPVTVEARTTVVVG